VLSKVGSYCLEVLSASPTVTQSNIWNRGFGVDDISAVARQLQKALRHELMIYPAVLVLVAAFCHLTVYEAHCFFGSGGRRYFWERVQMFPPRIVGYIITKVSMRSTVVMQSLIVQWLQALEDNQKLHLKRSHLPLT
jgi:hypothetical protein